jgi:hypothetical protein
MQYAIVGGQVIIDKVVFAKECLLPNSALKKIIRTEEKDAVQPEIVKTDKTVTICYNDASDVILDENFYDIIKKLKIKYKEKITGRVVIRITALTAYHIIIDLNSEDGRIVYD